MSLPFISWFLPQSVIGGDWPYFWPEQIKEFLSYTYVWDSSLNGGLGKSNIEILWLNSYLGYIGHLLVNTFGIPWQFAEKLMFFWPIIILAFIGGYVLSRLVTKNRLLRVVAGIIYLTNTYFLMIAAGGQVGILLSYAIAPISIYSAVKLLRKSMSKNTQFRALINPILIFSTISALQILFEPRIFLITCLGILIFIFVHIVYLVSSNDKSKLLRRFSIAAISFAVSAGIVLLLHMFWILPAFISLSQSQTIVTVTGSVDYFSFTRFENAFSLLHPNWPENIFGKTYFMKFYFLFIPFIAFGSFALFTKKTVKKLSTIQLTSAISVGLLIIIGAFLAKGTNDPFGGIYQLLADYIPGFIAFRDSSKFFVLVAIGYSLLIPFSLAIIVSVCKKRRPFITTKLVVALFISFWIALHFFSGKGMLSGTFTSETVPEEYYKLHKVISEDSEFFRTLWVPKRHRFAPSTSLHPVVSATEYVSDYSIEALSDFLNDPYQEEYLKAWGYKYVVLPKDTHAEVFVDDHKYSQEIYQNTKDVLDSVSYLTYIVSFDDLVLYEIKEPMDKIMYSFDDDLSNVSYNMHNPTSYSVTIHKKNKNGLLIFSEKFDPFWVLTGEDGIAIKSELSDDGMNRFRIPSEKSGTYSLYYTLQDWGRYGLIISLVALFSIVMYTLYWLYSKRRHAKA